MLKAPTRRSAVLLMGPTGSGKSDLAVRLAEELPLEIISVDSALVYRGMDIGTAKPDRAARGRVAHHLIDIVDPTESYSAGCFRDDALALVAQIHARGKVPVLAGGTMLYFRALTRGLANLPPAQPALRRAIEERAAESGWPALHAELAAVDAKSAARIKPTDAQRIQRALEVHGHTGRALSDFHGDARSPSELPFEALQISLEPSARAVLHQRIAERFRAMLAAGLVAEVESLRRRYALDARLPAMRAVGYRQAWETLDGNASAATLEARGIAATRQLAKRQLTWLRSMDNLERFDCLRSDLAQVASDRVARFLEP
jgi:tRNA dimethylallyltransferase